jgi:hypothetical protein
MAGLGAPELMVLMFLVPLVLLVLIIVAVRLAARSTKTSPSLPIAVPAGWYPQGQNLMRYWDGAQWVGPPQPAPASQP